MKLQPRSLEEYLKRAECKMDKQAYGYFISGSDDEVTVKNNVSAFSNIYLAPRVLVNMSALNTKTKILGHTVNVPFGIAPMAMQKLLHPDGQIIAARQAMLQNTAYGLSMLTSTKVGEVAKTNGKGLRILQLYFMKNAQYTLEVLKLAQKNGFKALAITVDTQIFGKRRIDQRNVFEPKVTLQLFNQLGYNFKMRDVQNQQRSFVHQIKNDVTWQDIKWIKKNTTLKIILKGVMSPQDIPRAEECGVDAIWISNHGGRQLDTAPATILALPSIRAKINQIGSKMELYIDGGIRQGSDIFKCLALGADFVFIGRGLLFSATDGEMGMLTAFKMLIGQFRKMMLLCGTVNVKAINQQYILKRPHAKL